MRIIGTNVIFCSSLENYQIILVLVEMKEPPLLHFNEKFSKIADYFIF